MVLRNIRYPHLSWPCYTAALLRFYTNLPTARYDLASGQELIDRIRAVQKAGGHVYLLLDKWEYEKMVKTETRYAFKLRPVN